MSDYKVSLGAKVRTDEIDKQLKDYDGKVNIGVNTNNITNGIDAAIRGYTASPIEVDSTLNTKGITDKIKSLNAKSNRKKVKVALDHDNLFDGLETVIANKTFATPLKVNVSLNWSGIASQIANPDFGATGKPTLNVDVDFDDQLIETKWNAFAQSESKKRKLTIPIRPTLTGADAAEVFSDVEETLATYVPKSKLKVQLFLSKAEINQAVTDYNRELANAEEKKIIFNAKLRADAIDGAINDYLTKYPDKLKIPIDLKINSELDKNTAFDAALKQKIEQYENTPVWISARLKKAKQGFLDQIQNVKVPIEATLANASAINDTLQQYSDKPLPVTAKLVPAAKGFANEITKTPIPIEAELAPDAINNAIADASKSAKKIPISVTIAPKDANDINNQIKQLKPFATENLEVGVKLDEKSVNTAIASVHPTETLKVKPDLMLEEADKQIEAYVPKVPIKVNVLVNDGDIDDKTGLKNAQDPITVNVRLDRKSINDEIKAFNPSENSKLNIGVNLDFKSHKDKETKEYIQKGIAQQIKEYQGKTKLKVGVELDKNSIETEISQFNPNTPVSVGVELTPESVQRVHSQIDDIRQRLQNLGGININLNSGTSNDGNNGGQDIQTVRIARGTSDATRAYREMISILGRLGTAKKDLEKLNLKTVKTQADVQEIEELTRQIDNLDGRYKELHKTFSSQFDAIQLDTLRIRLETIEEKLERIRSRALEAEDGLDKVASSGQNANGSDNGLAGGSSNTNVSDITNTSDVSDVIGKFKEADIVINATNDQINNFKTALKEVGFNSSSVESIGEEFRTLGVTVTNVTTKLNKDGSVKLTVKGLDKFKNAVTYVNNIGSDGSLGNWSETISKDVNNIGDNFRTLKETAQKIANIRIKIFESSNNAQEVEKLTKELEELNYEYDELFNSTQGGLDNGQIAQLNNIAEKATVKIAELKAKLASEIKIKLNDGTFDNSISNITSRFNSLKNKSDEMQAAMNEVNEALVRMQTASANNNIDELIKANQDYEKALKAVKNQLDINARAEQDVAAAEKLADDRKAFQSKIDAWLTKNSAAAKQFGSQLLELKEHAESCDRVTLDHLEREFKSIDKKAEAAGVRTKTFGDSLKAQFEKYRSYFSIASLFMYAEQGLRSMFEQVKLIDSAMTELKKVTNETDASYNHFLKNAASKAKELGTTIDGLVSSTADFARLGYGFEDSQKLAEVANIYAVVGDEIEGVEDATQSLVSTMAAFKSEMNGMNDGDFALSIVDKMNEVSNNFAISSGGIGEALQRSASSMAAANNTIDETIAMITAANEVAQNPEKVGNAMKTMSMRIRGAKTELEEAGESTDGMAESTATLRAEIKALSGVDIMLNENTFKSTYQIMDELSKKWGDLSDIAQATIIELVAGKHQGNVFSSLMANFQTARDALTTSLGSSGSAMAEHAKWSESLEARLNKLAAAWQSLSQTFMNSDALKLGIDVLNAFIETIELLIDNLGIFGTIGLGVAGKNIFSYFKGAKEAEKNLNDVVASVENLTKAVQNNINVTNAETEANLENAASETAEANANTASATTEVAETEANLASTTSELAEVEANAASTTSELAETEANLASTTSEAGEAAASATSTTAELAETAANAAGAISEVTEASAGAAGGFAKFATSTAGVVAGIGILVAVLSLAYSAYQNAKEAAEEARQEVIQSSSEFIDAASSFEKAYIKYSGKTDLTADEEAELASAIHGTADALVDKSDALQTVVNSSNDYIASLEAIKNAELKAAERAAKDKKENAGKSLKEATLGLLGFTSEVDISLGFSAGGINKSDTIKIAEDILGDYITNNNSVRSNMTEHMLQLGTDASIDEIVDYYEALIEYRERLSDADLSDTQVYERVSAVISSLAESVDVYIEGTYEAAKANYQLGNGIPKTTEEYIKMREAILGQEDIQQMSIDTKLSILNSLDSEYNKLFDLTTAEAQARRFVGIIKGYGDGTKDGTNEIGTVETFLNMRTAVNNNECTVGEYLSTFHSMNAMTSEWSDKEKEEFNLAFGLDTDSIKKQYDDISKYLSRNYLDDVDTTGWHTGLRLDFENYRNQKIREIQKMLGNLTASELAAVVNIKGEIDWENASQDDILKQIKEEVELNEALSFTIAIDVEKEGIDALNTALAESKSATGLATESIATLKSRYKDLDSYDAAALFEETANGIRINSTELAKLEKEYKDFNKQKTDKTLATLKEEYDKLTDEIAHCTNDQEKLNDLYLERDAVLNQINNVATLAAQYDGLTSAYKEWQSAQEAGQDRDMYESILSGREEIEGEMSRGWLDDATVEYLELLSGKDLSTAGIQAQIEAYKELNKTIDGTNYKIWDFFTQDKDGNSTSEGVYNFFEAVKDASDETAAYIKDGKYHFDFEGFEYNGKVGDAAIAELLGTSEELVQIILKAAEDAGFVVNIKGEYTDLANMSDDIQNMNEQLKRIGATEYTFNIKSTDLNYINEQITEAKSALQYFENRDGKINLDDSDVRAAATIMAQLVYRKSDLENPTLMSIDVSEPATKLEEVLGLAQQLKDANANLEIQTEIGADTTEAQAQIDSLLAQISSEKYADIVTSLSIDATSKESAIASINAISADAMISLGLDTSKIDGYVVEDKYATVTYEKDSTEVDEYDPPDFTRTVTFTVDSYSVDIYNPDNLTRTVTYKVKTEGEVSEANGTANVNGTAFAGGTAFKQGNWGIKGSGTALVGELGTETLVRDGHFYTIGDSGAEFIKYRQGDIIFNHKQTEELFKNGKVTSGGGRGRALAEGTAFAIGSGGFGFRDDIRSIVKEEATVSVKTTKETEVGSYAEIGENIKGALEDAVSEVTDSSDSSSSSSYSEEEFEDTFDWVEIAISRIERAIDQLDKKANNVYQSWSDRNSALTSEINKVGDEIDLQQKAYDRYIQEANSVGLSSSWAEKVRNGEIDINTIADEDLAEKIRDYQTWYEKALACEDAIEDLKEKEAELYAQRVENVATQYEGILGVIEHEKNMLEEYISQAEAQGYMVSGEYYKALMGNEQDTLSELEKQKAAMLEELQTAMESGTIAEGSEAWYDMIASIDEVTLAIAESETALLEYEQILQQLNWKTFDLLQDKISAVTEEADFLIDLLSSDKLYDENGNLTDEGSATMGLHGQNYNTYMHQADLAAEEAEKLRQQLEEDPYDAELEERYREMIALQQEYILAAENEKEAIRDMVEEGIQLELDALDERIQKYEESIESARDLYEYNKKVKEQAEEIASLEKQRSAYLGDTSEEGRARLQQIEVSLKEAKEELQETEYDRYISDQQQLLDELRLQYEEILNMRLDNIDALIADMIAEINADSAVIGDTIRETADSVGYTLSDSMQTIWDASTTKINDVLTVYGEKFSSAQTTTNNALNTININLQNMIAQLNKIANTNVESASTSSAANSEEAKTPEEPPKEPVEEIPNTSSTIEVGGKINAGSAKIYDYAGDTSGESQYFKNDPIYTVLGEKNGYLKVRHHKLSSGVTGWFKKGDVKAYASGKKNFMNDEVAWTQDGGREFIVRPSDGAILTPIAKGDSVLTSTASKNIWSMANTPTEFIREHLKFETTNIPNGSATQSSYTQHIDNVVFRMDNIKNYEEMLSAMKADKNFERLILSMSIDRIAGKSGLAKGKSIR